MNRQSAYYPACIRVGDRRLWQVRMRRNIHTGVASIVWSGPGKANCRAALAEFREREAFFSRNWPHVEKPNLRSWYWESTHNGAFITIHAPGNRSCVLQGDDAAAFLREADRTNDQRTDTDLCREYDDVCKVAGA